MNKKWLILMLLLPALMSMVAASTVPGNPMGSRPRSVGDTVIDLTGNSPVKSKTVDVTTISLDSIITDNNTADSILDEPDTLLMDSLARAIYQHNKKIDDSLRLDSINRAKSNGIESPVKYSAKDSLVYDAESKTAFLYGSTNVEYQNMDLKSEKVDFNLNNNLVHAMGVADSTAKKGLRGTPEFKWGSDEYESDTISFNFKTKKGMIRQVYTEQEDGYLRGEKSKRSDDGTLYLEHATYTTCDEEHPDFYIALSRAKVRPGKDVVFGSAYLVVADVPMPIAIPYGFFPFSKKYSSGFIMPTYGDESSRGFYLRDGGYYFAINDKWDLKLLAEIYTKGSWGVSAASNYVKRYRYSGNFYFSYQDTRTGDKGMPDYNHNESFKLQWNHTQDSKANPYSSLSARVNFATSSYERNNLTGMYNPQALTQSLRTSSVNWGTNFSSIGMSINATAELSQNMRDTVISMTLPNLSINVTKFYPFKRKNSSGKQRWYEKIGMTYRGEFRNSIETKESEILHSNIIKDWKNAMQHTIPISANFTLFNYISVNPGINFVDRMYTSKVKRSWDADAQKEVRDTIWGFNNVYNWSANVSIQTTLYGMYKPSPKIFGNKIVAVRHVFTPKVSFGYSPDFGTSRYGYFDSYEKVDANGNVSTVDYSYYDGYIFGHPSNAKSGSVTFDMSNNIEMKVRTDVDSIKKISIIDELGANISYNMAAKERQWSDLTVRLRLKWWKNYTFKIDAAFATYAYDLDENGRPYIGTHTEWSRGRFGRFRGMSQNISYTLTPEKIKKWFGGGDDKEDEETDDDEDIDTERESNIDDVMVKNNTKKKSGGKAETDEDGYMKFNMPWSLTIQYGIDMRENTGGKFNTKSMRYPYKFAQTLNVHGNIRISDGWNIDFQSGYDFENKKISMTRASLSRDLHCFNMSCSVVLAPYTSYNFSFRCNAATLTDALKYDKRSGMSNAVRWY
jgi:hypothetical protein